MEPLFLLLTVNSIWVFFTVFFSIFFQILGDEAWTIIHSHHWRCYFRRLLMKRYLFFYMTGKRKSTDIWRMTLLCMHQISFFLFFCSTGKYLDFFQNIPMLRVVEVSNCFSLLWTTFVFCKSITDDLHCVFGLQHVGRKQYCSFRFEKVLVQLLCVQQTLKLNWISQQYWYLTINEQDRISEQ